MTLVVSALLLSVLVVVPAVLLVQAGIDWVANRVEVIFPGRSWAVQLGFWMRWVAPATLSVVLAILLIFRIIGR